jgi:hypothetical protein
MTPLRPLAFRHAGATGRGLSTEIRQRLQLTYDQQSVPRDVETSGLVGSIQMLADNLAGDLGEKWHEHRYALAAFKAGVVELLARYQPTGDESKRPDTRLVGEPDDPPEVVGRIHARLIRKANFED